MGRNVIDLTGQRFGRLTVIERADDHVGPSGRKHVVWRCKCDCGNEVIVRSVNLKSGHTKSCGCLRRGLLGKRRMTHGYSKERLYRIWNGIIQRCYNPKNNAYKNYGMRGIAMCDEWRYSYEPFREWSLNNGYDEAAERKYCQIDRIDVDGPYSPENCRWVTSKENANNRRNNVFINYNGEKKTFAQWCSELGLNANTVWSRINNLGWDTAKAIETPVQERNRIIEYNGETNSMVEWSKKLNIPYKTLYYRFYNGWPTEEVLFGRKKGAS